MNGTLRSFHTMKQIILVKTCENPRHVALCHLYELICKCVTISCIFRPGAKRSNRGSPSYFKWSFRLSRRWKNKSAEPYWPGFDRLKLDLRSQHDWWFKPCVPLSSSQLTLATVLHSFLVRDGMSTDDIPGTVGALFVGAFISAMYVHYASERSSLIRTSRNRFSGIVTAQCCAYFKYYSADPRRIKFLVSREVLK